MYTVYIYIQVKLVVLFRAIDQGSGFWELLLCLDIFFSKTLCLPRHHKQLQPWLFLQGEPWERIYIYIELSDQNPPIYGRHSEIWESPHVVKLDSMKQRGGPFYQ